MTLEVSREDAAKKGHCEVCMSATTLASTHDHGTESMDLYGLRRLILPGSSILWIGCAGIHPLVSVKSSKGKLDSYISEP